MTHRFGVDGTTATRVAQYPEGAMIVSPPNCAHEWVNPSATEGHASLVFTLGEGFPGNLFVRPDDPRILKGGAPRIFDPNAELVSFARAPERLREIPVPVTLGAIEEVLVKDSYVVVAKERTVTFLYAVGGRGHVEGGPDRIAIAPEILVVARKPLPLRVVADPGDPLAIFVVRIGDPGR